VAPPPHFPATEPTSSLVSDQSGTSGGGLTERCPETFPESEFLPAGRCVLDAGHEGPGHSLTVYDGAPMAWTAGAPLTAPSQEQVNVVANVAEKALAKKERTTTVNVKTAQRRLQRPCFRCGDLIQKGKRYEETKQGPACLSCEGKGAK
jgi:hypothetical protein